jgi:hypothetical protein
VRHLIAARREPVQLSGLSALLHPLAPALVIELAMLAVSADRVDRDGVVDFLCDDVVLRVTCGKGRSPVVVVADAGAADVTITAGARELPEVLAGRRAAAVDGDASLAKAILGWVQDGLA